MKNLFTSRKFRQGSIATAITVIVIAIIVVINMVAGQLTDRYSLSMDLTQDQIFEVTTETVDYMAALQKDVEIYVLNTEQNFIMGGEYFVQANEVIKKYEKLSPHVTLEYIDLVRTPTFESKFPDLQLNTSSIVVACGDKAVDVTPYDLYNVETDPYYGQTQITSSKAEQAMTSAILRVTSDTSTVVTMLTGHNEMELAGLKSLFEVNNYEVREQSLVTDAPAEDVTIAVISAPTQDFSEDELKKLDAFLDNGGKKGKTLFYFASIEQPALPNLSAFLAEWGISVEDSVVFESSADLTLQMNMLQPVVMYNEEVYAETARAKGLVTLVPYARPLKALFESQSGVAVSAPLQFSPTSGIVPADATQDWQPSAADISGPIPAMLIAQKTAYDGTTPIHSSVVVCGSPLAVEDSYLQATSIGNSDYFLNVANVLSNREDTINIQPKTIGGNELGVQSQQIVVLVIVLVVLLPLAVVILGIATWVRRRHR